MDTTTRLLSGAAGSTSTPYSVDGFFDKIPSDAGLSIIDPKFMPTPSGQVGSGGLSDDIRWLHLIADDELLLTQINLIGRLNMSTPNDIMTATRSATTYTSLWGGTYYDASLLWRPGGMEFFYCKKNHNSSWGPAVLKYSTTTAYDAANGNYTLISTQQGFTGNPVYGGSPATYWEPRSYAFNPAGSKLYITYWAHHPKPVQTTFQEISLTTAWDPAGGHTATNVTLPGNWDGFYPSHSPIHWYDNGNKFIVFGVQLYGGGVPLNSSTGIMHKSTIDIRTFSASTPYSIVNATAYASTPNGIGSAETKYILGHGTTYDNNFCLNSTGTRLYVSGVGGYFAIAGYELSTPYDFSTATLPNSSPNIGHPTDFDGNGRNGSYYSSYARELSVDEKYFFRITRGHDNGYNAGSNNKGYILNKYELATAGDVSSGISRVSDVYFSDFGGPAAFGSNSTSTSGMGSVQTFQFNKSTIFANGANRAPGCLLSVVVKMDSSWPTSMKVFNFTSTTPYTFNSSTASLFSQEDMSSHLSSHNSSGFYDMKGLQYAPDGSAFYLYGNAYHWSKHTLTTAFDLSTISATAYFDHTNNGYITSSPDQYTWSHDGTTYFRFTGWDSWAGIHRYETSVPFDLTQGNVTYADGDSPPAWNTPGNGRPHYALKYGPENYGLAYNSDGTAIYKLPHGGYYFIQPSLWKVDL